MKYRPDINKIPESERVRSDREEVRRRKREVAKFARIVDDKIWWKSLTSDQHWEIYVDYCWLKNKNLKNHLVNFLEKVRINYPGDLSKMRDMKIDELFK